MKKLLLFMLAPALTLSANHFKHNPITKIKTMEKTGKTISKESYTATLLVDKSAAEAYNAIKNFRGWWSEEIVGNTDKLNEEFFYHHKTIHLCKMKPIEMVAGKKLIYLVTENEFSFTKDKSEWINTKLIFELSEEAGKTKIKFTHEGLVPKYECYNVCNDAWGMYINTSLRDYINTGKGQPNPKEGEGINAELDRKWNLKEAASDNKTSKQKEDFTYTIVSSKTPEEIYPMLIDVRSWWTGLYNEKITGTSDKLNGAFDYYAGEGIHYSKQKLIEAVPNKKIVWLVTDSKLTFLKDKSEWTNTKIRFDLKREGNATIVTFTHEGLMPEIECYTQCTSGWMGYLKNLEKTLK